MDDLPTLSEVMSLRNAQKQPAQALIRLVRCQVLSRATKPTHVLSTAEQLYPQDERLHVLLRAAVAAGSLSNLSALSPYRTLASELIAVARPSSIILRLDQVRTVPARTRIPKTTASAVVGWVGEGSPKPVSQMAFSEVLLDVKKLAGIVLITTELAKLSGPAAEAVIRADLVASINYATDAAFVSSTAGSASRPAGILNGVSAIVSSGSTPAAISADVSDAISAMVAAGGAAQSLVALAHPSTGAQIGLTFGGAGASFGIPVLASTAIAAGSLVILDQAEILLADEGVELALSNQATLQADSAPSDPAPSTISLWQHNLEGIRSERFINWTSAHGNSAAASVVTGIA